MKKSFINTAIKSMKTTGAISQSSSFLVNSMLKHVDFSKDINIVELGAGNGNVTKAILAKMNSHSKLHSFEINDVFFKEVSKISDNRLQLTLDSAEYLHNHMEDHSVDAIISSLPLALLNKQLKEDIFKSVEKITKSKSVFIQFQYSLNDYKLIKNEFSKVDLKLTVLNIPPAFIYIGRNR